MEITTQERKELIIKAYYRGFLGGSLLTAIIIVIADLVIKLL